MADTRRRTKRRKKKKAVSMSIALLCVVAAGCLALLLTPVFGVKNITVTGNKTIATEDIVRASGIVEGSNIFSVSVNGVRDRLSGMNGVDSVKVRRSLPSTVRITVTEGRPLVYVEDGGSLVGLTVDGKVVEVVAAASMPASRPVTKPEKSAKDPADGEADGEDAEEPDGDGEDDGTENGAEDEPDGDGGPDEGDAAPRNADESKAGDGRTVVRGMGGMEYGVGKRIKFADEIKGENLFKLMEEFLSAQPGFTEVDMSVYDNVSMTYNGRLRVRLGPVEELDYKLKLFQKLIAENLGDDPDGTLDLQRQTYSPKK